MDGNIKTCPRCLQLERTYGILCSGSDCVCSPFLDQIMPSLHLASCRAEPALFLCVSERGHKQTAAVTSVLSTAHLRMAVPSQYESVCMTELRLFMPL